MTITKHEILTVGTLGEAPQDIINAMREMPRDAQFVDLERDGIATFDNRRVRSALVFTFRREVTNE